MNDVTIRPYRPEDKDGVVRLWFECDLVIPRNNPVSDIERKMAVDPEWFLVGLSEGRVVATCMAGYEGHRGWINYLAVSPPYQRRGIAKRLVKEAERLLAVAGCPKINLQIREGNEEVIRFYEGIGYVRDPIISMGKRLVEDEPYEDGTGGTSSRDEPQ